MDDQDKGALSPWGEEETLGAATMAALARVEAIATAIKIVFNMDNSD